MILHPNSNLMYFSFQILASEVELCNDDHLKKLVNNTVDKFGQIDVLVNNAGIIKMGSIENTTLEDYDELMNVNARSVFRMMNLTVPHLIKTKGNAPLNAKVGQREAIFSLDGLSQRGRVAPRECPPLSGPAIKFVRR